MEFFELTSNYNYVFTLSYPNTALTDIITAHSPGMTVWRKPYFSGAGYRVGPSRICILIGIIWLNEKGKGWVRQLFGVSNLPIITKNNLSYLKYE